jgi:hypothetical protein
MTFLYTQLRSGNLLLPGSSTFGICSLLLLLFLDVCQQALLLLTQLIP